MFEPAAWAAKYIGIPYRPRGRGFDGVDCYGLYWLVQRTEFGRELPLFDLEFNAADVAQIERLLGRRREGGFQRLAAPEIGCGAMLLTQGLPAHIGVVAGVKPVLLLHAPDGRPVELMRLGTLRCPAATIEGYYDAA